ncbi:MAG: hypothetical protein R6W81_03065, partial [Bacteroidales bacterium]
AEYMWWNNVETRPGSGYPTGWEDQDHYRGGWKKGWVGVELKLHSRPKGLANLFYNPALPDLQDYYMFVCITDSAEKSSISLPAGKTFTEYVSGL